MGALSTYWDFIPFNKGKDNFFMHGFFIALSYFPYCIWGNMPWLNLGIRCIVLALVIGGLNWFVNKYKIANRDKIEEEGRGASIPLSLLI